MVYIIILFTLLFILLFNTKEKFTLEKKIVLITGATGGIGSHIANRISKINNYMIILNGKNSQKLKELKDKINKKMY